MIGPRRSAASAVRSSAGISASGQWPVVGGWVSSAAIVLVSLVAAIAASSQLPLLLVALTLCLSLTGALRSCLYGFRPAAFVFHGFTFAWLGVGPAVQLSTGTPVWGDTYVFLDTDRVNFALVLGVVFVGAVLLGENWGRRGAGPPAGPPVRVRGWVLGSLAGVLAVLAWLAVRVQGGLAVLFSSRAGRRQALELSGIDLASVGGIGPALTIILPAATSTVLMHLVLRAIRDDRLRRPSGGPRLDHLLVGGVALAGLVLFANPISNSRFVSAICLGSVALAWAQPRSRRAGRLVGLLGGLVMLVGYPLARWVGANSIAYSPGLGRLTPELLYASPDFDGFQQVVNSVAFVEQHGLSGGRYTLSALLFFLPRSVWEGKSRPAALDVAEEAGYWFTNLSLPIHAELYLDFGVLGVLVGALVIGRIVGRSDLAWQADDRSVMGLLSPVIALTMLGVLRGPLGSLVPTYLTIILLLVAALWMGPRQAGGPSPGTAGRRGSRPSCPDRHTLRDRHG